MTEWQKAAERLRAASERYKAAIQAELEACNEWVAATKAMDAVEDCPQDTKND